MDTLSVQFILCALGVSLLALLSLYLGDLITNILDSWKERD